jgi:hypothetical protein
MDLGEFIDTYYDDLTTIDHARAAVYSHPLRDDYALAEWRLDASFSRILVVFGVAGIEATLESWRARNTSNVLEKYFADNVTNGERVTSLYQAFLDAGSQVDREILEDYLAIKYLRNILIRAQCKEDEKDWLDARGFPSDIRKLTNEHFDKIKHVNQNMLLCLGITNRFERSARNPINLVGFSKTITPRKDESGIIRVRDIVRIIWNNLERIDSYIYRDIEKVAVTEKYDWSAGLSETELRTLGHDECKRLFYLAARRAGEENHELLVRHRDLANEALEFWREYWQRVIAPHDQSIKSALDVFTSPHFNPEMPVWSVLANVEEDDAYQLADDVLQGTGPLTSEQVVRAFHAGKLAYGLVPNIMPVSLLTVRLPIVDPRNTPVYLREAERAIEVFRLNRAWYECVENNSRFTDECLGFYVRMCKEFAQRPLG